MYDEDSIRLKPSMVLISMKLKGKNTVFNMLQEVFYD